MFHTWLLPYNSDIEPGAPATKPGSLRSRKGIGKPLAFKSH
jgi:hypothetical protein